MLATLQPNALAAPAPEVIVQEPVVEAKIEWTKENIEKEIRKTFPEAPNTAVAIVKGEGGLVTERQSDYYRDGVREPSFCAWQIHEPSWMELAKSLGYGDYKTNVESCIKMARVIYKDYEKRTGDGFNAWSAYTNGSYKKYL